jgi:hypothetical protein
MTFTLQNVSYHVPIVACIVASIALTVVVNFVMQLFRK